MVFQYLDKESLLNCREVCKDFMMYVDTKTPLWSTMSLLEAVKDENLEENVRLGIVEKILQKKKVTWATIKHKMLKAVEEDKPSVVRQLMKKMTDEKDGLG